MRCDEAQLLIDLYLADDPLLSPRGRRRLEKHLHDCPSCRAAYERGSQVVVLVKRHGQISEDTLALLAESHSPTVTLRTSWGRYIRRFGAVAACLAIAVLDWRLTWSLEVPTASPEGAQPTIESIGSDGPILSGTTIQTSAEETRSLILNGRYQVVMNVGTRLSIEPLTITGRGGCQVDFSPGEVHVHVTHDGNPFVVQTTHGWAVITGTTFDVKVTEAGTTLVVTEGSTRFKSEGGAVPTGLLLSSLQACDHLRYTRLLIWLAIEADQYTSLEVPGPQL